VSTSIALHTTHELRLIALGLAVGNSSSLDDACAVAVDRIGSSLGVSCAIRAYESTRWRVIARFGTASGSEAIRATDAAIDSAIDANRALMIPVGQAPNMLELVIVRPGESTESIALTGTMFPGGVRLLDDPEWRKALGGVLTSSLQLVQLRAHRAEGDRRTDCVERFSCALVGISDSPALHRAIVEQMARAVGAEIGAMAVFVPHDNSLVITATLGYPSVLVEHVRIAPGVGVLGRVFTSGEPVLATNLAAVPGQITRRRYRTDSYIALPLAGPEGVMAVVSLTDKAGGTPFTDADLALLLRMSIPAALAVARELLRDRTNDLAHLATVDALTGLFNRRYFETRLEQELQRQLRQADDLSLLMLDLDNFKELNDTQGHLVGDLALREVADILRRAVRIFDVCGRYGGEEFVILMPGAGSSTALRIAERIRRQVEQHFSTGLRSSVPVPLTVSVGVSTATPNVTRDALVAQADAALLRAKGTGKNQVNLHDEGAQ
jgi:diguanylate cyclase (GGDEF)-like protein